MFLQADGHMTSSSCSAAAMSPLLSLSVAQARSSLRTPAALFATRIPRPYRSLGARRTYSSAFTDSKLCPSCSSPLPTALPVCTNCSYIAPIPESMTYHEMLGAAYEPNPFVVDPTAIKNQFRAVQAVVHPDRWVAKPPDHQAIAAAMSARTNEALHRLSNSLRRAEYILAREGFAGEETDKLEDMGFLVEVMEAREGLASSETAGEVEEIRAENDVKIKQLLHEIERLAGEKNWDGLRRATVKLKYRQGIESAAAAWPTVEHDH
ncbi:Co-chaperone Hsc20 [Fomes fomentarius]|nr:Co-chaperone Hsc20 [Fomes fomentarius]